MILQDVDGRVASNQTISWKTNHLMISNLEPRHQYYIKVAGFNSQGVGPFSQVLEVKPEPSLALGAVATSDEEGSNGWLVPFIICFVVTIGILATATLLFIKYHGKDHPGLLKAFTKAHNSQRPRLYNLTSQTLASLSTKRQKRRPGMDIVHSTSTCTANFDLSCSPVKPSASAAEFQLIHTSNDSNGDSMRSRGHLGRRSAADGASATSSWLDNVPENEELFNGTIIDASEATAALNSSRTVGGKKQRRKSNLRDSLSATVSSVYKGIISSGSNTVGRMKRKPSTLMRTKNARARRRSIGGTTGTSEDDSDYAYIDRSTHSITGYLQSPNKGQDPRPRPPERQKFIFNENEMCKTTSFIDSPSPYATIQVLRKQKHGSQPGRWKRPSAHLHKMQSGNFHTMRVRTSGAFSMLASSFYGQDYGDPGQINGHGGELKGN